MKKNKHCPKCNSKEIAKFPDKKGKFNVYNSLAVDALHTARVERYICKACGYMEEYVVVEDIKYFD